MAQHIVALGRLVRLTTENFASYGMPYGTHGVVVHTFSDMGYQWYDIQCLTPLGETVVVRLTECRLEPAD